MAASIAGTTFQLAVTFQAPLGYTAAAAFSAFLQDSGSFVFQTDGFFAQFGTCSITGVATERIAAQPPPVSPTEAPSSKSTSPPPPPHQVSCLLPGWDARVERFFVALRTGARVVGSILQASSGGGGESSSEKFIVSAIGLSTLAFTTLLPCAIHLLSQRFHVFNHCVRLACACAKRK